MKVVDLVLISPNQFWDAKNQQRINSNDWYSVQILNMNFSFKKIDVGMVKQWIFRANDDHSD